jgi:hypothetical protein
MRSKVVHYNSMEGGLHRYALRRKPEAILRSRRLEPTTQDEDIARQFGARDNFIGTPHSAGSGAEKLAYKHQDDKRIILIQKREFPPRGRKTRDTDLSTTEARKQFIRRSLLNNIIHILVPESVSRSKQVASGFGVMVNENIEGRNVTQMNEVVRRLVFTLKMRAIGLAIDSSPHNFIRRDSDGLPVYIDTLYEKKSPKKIAILLARAFRRAKLNEDQRSKAASLLAKYNKLI